MNLNHPDIQTYLQNLPPVVQKCIGSVEWKTKILEIGKKYSLQPGQINSLEMEILLVALGVESDEEMVANIQTELDISSTLAEQLTNDANERVYQWIYKKLTSEKQPEQVFKTENTLDIPPPNLPGEIIGEGESPTNTPEAPLETPQEQAPAYISTPEAALVTPPVQPHTSLQEQTKDFFAPQTLQASPTFSFQPNHPQQPISSAAPRTPISQPEITPSIDPKPSFISNKLSQPTKPQTPLAETPKMYSVDPYREPLE